ncbi:hypothetical protein D082_12000 [Synechocystis sp. PCC 6714]|nr:hypothetical protein D082_12000 [Synechocystis sp. PCC 6714]
MVDGDYQMKLLRGDGPIVPSQFSGLNLNARQVLAYER